MLTTLLACLTGPAVIGALVARRHARDDAFRRWLAGDGAPAWYAHASRIGGGDHV